MICCLGIAFSRTEHANFKYTTHININRITQHSTARYSTALSNKILEVLHRICIDETKPQLVCVCVWVWIMISMELHKWTSAKCEQREKTVFFLILAQHTRRQRRRHCALPFETEWISRNSERNEARNYVYVILNRLLKTNWGQHWDAVWRWLNRFLTHCSNENGMYELLRETHSHTHTRQSLCKIIAIRTYLGMEFLYTANTNKPANRPIFYHVSFCCRHFFSHSVFRWWCFGGRRWRKLTCTHTEYGVRVCVWSDFLHLFCAQKNTTLYG